jgi:hypothetical protein
MDPSISVPIMINNKDNVNNINNNINISNNNMNNAWKSGSPPPPPSVGDAFRVQLNYAQIKSKLRPTNNGHYDSGLPETAPAPEIEQQQLPQQPLYQWDLSE